MIETVIPSDLPEVDSLLQHLEQYDYIAFSSRKAIEAFANRAENYPEVQKHFPKVGFCAIGKDAEYLQERLKVSNAVHPSEASPKGIANELAKLPGIANRRIAVLTPRVEKVKEPDVVPDFLKQLKETGLQVTRINAYVTRPVAMEKIEEAAGLITSGTVSCVAFTSGTEIEGLLLGFKDRKLPEGIVVACFGPYTAAYAKKIGVRVDLVATDFSSFAGFIHAIKAYYDKQE